MLVARKSLLGSRFIMKCCSRMMQPLRHMSEEVDLLYSDETCEDCVMAYPMPKLRKGLKKRKKPNLLVYDKVPCWQALRRTEFKCRTDPEFDIPAFIDRKKECLEDPCAMEAPPIDLLKYRPSDKLRREYQRTWVECVLKRRARKAKCVFKAPAIKRRQRAKRRDSTCDTSCVLGAPALGLGACSFKPVSEKGCLRVTMPGCKDARVPGKCQRGRTPSACRKRLTKYPSFSECLIDPLPEMRPAECGCLRTPMMCEVWEYFRNKRS